MCWSSSVPTVPPVPLGEFRDIPFVMLKKEGNDLGVRGAAICREAGFLPKVAISTDQVLTAANIAAQGIGAAFLRGDLFRYSPIQNRFCLYTLESNLSRRDIFFVTKRARYVNNAMRMFLMVAGAVFPEEDPQTMSYRYFSEFP